MQMIVQQYLEEWELLGIEDVSLRLVDIVYLLKLKFYLVIRNIFYFFNEMGVQQLNVEQGQDFSMGGVKEVVIGFRNFEFQLLVIVVIISYCNFRCFKRLFLIIVL